jgi:protein gp37
MKSMPGYAMTKKEIRIVEDEMKNGHGSGKTIFVCSGIDMFCDAVPEEMIRRVLQFASRFDNEYLFQSKNPVRFLLFVNQFPARTILGTTIETNREELIEEVSTSVPPVLHRAIAMRRVPDKFKRMVSIEPIMDFDSPEMFNLINYIQPGFVSIGADSKGHGLKEPSKEKIEKLIGRLSNYTSVYEKKNLSRLL